MAQTNERGWTVLLVLGASGTGKSRVAKAVGRGFGVPWLQADDLRLALQFSGARLPSGADTAASRFFLESPDVWSLPPERLCEGLIDVGRAMAPAIEIVVAHHVATAEPLVMEGDGILPSLPLLERSAMRGHVASGEVRAVCLREAEEEAILATMRARDRGFGAMPEAGQRAEARATWLFGTWLAEEAGRVGVPTVAARPWGSLGDRVVGASR